MILKSIEDVLFQEGYRFCNTEPKEIHVFYKYYQEGFHVIMLVDMDSGYGITAEQHQIAGERIKSLFFHPQGKLADFPDGFPVYHVEALTILSGRQSDTLRELCVRCPDTWAFDTEGNRLLVYENQPGDFWGLRHAIERMEPGGGTNESYKSGGAPLKQFRNKIKYIPFVTVGIVITNILVFMVLEFIGDTENPLFIASHGGMYPEFILYNHQWWRILTSGFIHYGLPHLANNMVIFVCVGSRLERGIGHLKLLVVYLAALIGGGMLSYAVMVFTGRYAVAAGASGAVFGAIGGLLWVVICHRGRFEGLTVRGLVFMLLLSLYYGISTIDVDNWAHIGGMITGFITAAILYHRKHQRC